MATISVSPERKEWMWAAIIALAAVLISCIPYGFGYLISSPQARFTGLIYNPDDSCVYLSWMRQAADGRFFFDNRFTTEPQLGRSINLFFWVMGLAARITHLPLIAAFHLGRIVTGFILLLSFYRFQTLFVLNPFARRASLLLAAFSAGLGFLIGFNLSGIDRPVDAWQPEAITFLNLYLNPLFCISQILMLGAFFHLIQAGRTHSAGQALFAGLLLLLLGNIHSYDIITTAVVWAGFLAFEAAMQRHVPWERLKSTLLAGVVALPSTAYQYWLYRHEMVFQRRAEVPTLSPALWWYLLGYGLVLCLAVYGLWLALRQRLPDTPPESPAAKDSRLLAVWAVLGFAIPYLPFAFQRKMVMGLHIPLCILAAFALTALLFRLPGRNIALILAVFVTAPTNIFSLKRDLENIGANQTNTGIHRAFLSSDELDAIAWLERQAHREDVVLSLPMIGVYIPALAGNRVYVGHWGETARFTGKFREVLRIFSQNTGDSARQDFLDQNRIAYLFWYNEMSQILPAMTRGREIAFAPSRKPYLEKVFSNPTITLFRVRRTR